ncbi:MAG: diguanylate cyclase (GGDEF)-like protein [Sulfurimonas sp.]|jgi:diguanylate cyclase (GGDEF)-like protein|uniref:putative bifunctional diguanylate cyclase/phosphodiesterase n=1 Tax=Sulfurimonas sp. TaxID=2022749 RepID=UPI0039E32CB4
MNSFKFKLFFAGILLSVLPMVIYQYVTFTQSSQTLKSTYAKELKQKTDLVTLLVNQSIAYTIKDLKSMSYNTIAWLNIDNMAQVESHFDNFEEMHSNVSSITLINDSSEIIFSTSRNTNKLKVLDAIDNQYFQKMKDVYVYESLNGDEVSVYLFHKTETLKPFYIIMEMNFQNIELLLSSFEDEILGDKSIFILSKKDKLVFSTNGTQQAKDFYHKISIFDDTTKIYEYTDFDNDKVISAYDTVFAFGENEAFGWKIVTSIPLDVINNKVHKTLKNSINLGIFITFLVFLLIILVSVNISNSIKKLLHFAKNLKEGNYGERVHAKNSIREFEELSTILNDMSSTIEKRNNELNSKNKLLQNLAHYDALTQIPNRILFQERLDLSIIRAKRHSTSIALFFIDLDQFKHINDSYGHDYGDEILKVTARRLKSTLRENDTVARLGGDEFTIILEEIKDTKYIDTIASTIIETVKQDIPIKGNKFNVGCSVGISLFPQDADNKDDLIMYADTAMYKAKALGRATYQFYSSDLTQISLTRTKLEKDIHLALKSEEFVVFYQPQYNCKLNKITGAEALVRWRKSDQTLVSPAEFLPLAEDIGVINLIDKFVIKSALQESVLLHSEGYDTFVISLNLSMKLLEEDDFVEEIMELLLETGCKPQWIELEITEGQIMNKYKSSIEKLNKLNKLGINIAIDDFGTGYSSLSYLKHMPINKLKIDKSFIDDVPEDIDDVEISKTIILLAKGLGLDIIAEGVETEIQRDFLVENGCDNIQGYLYSKPLSAYDMRNFLKNN